MENSKQFNTTAIRLFHYNEVTTALLDITLNREKDENGYTKHMVFFGMTGGESNGQGLRTFNKENKITMKLRPEQVYEIKYALEGYFTQAGVKLLTDKFTIFTDPSKSGYSNGSKKMLSVYPIEANPERKTPYSVGLSMSSGNLKASMMIPYTKAHALSKVLEKLMDVYLEDLHQVSLEEGKNMTSRPGYSRDDNSSKSFKKDVGGPFDINGTAPSENGNPFGFEENNAVPF